MPNALPVTHPTDEKFTPVTDLLFY